MQSLQAISVQFQLKLRQTYRDTRNINMQTPVHFAHGKKCNYTNGFSNDAKHTHVIPTGECF